MEKDSWSKFKFVTEKIVIGVIAATSITGMIFSICTFCKVNKDHVPCPMNGFSMRAQNNMPQGPCFEQNDMQGAPQNDDKSNMHAGSQKGEQGGSYNPGENTPSENEALTQSEQAKSQAQ